MTFADRFAPTATIAAGQSLSAAVDLNRRGLAGLIMPAGWDAAGLSFRVSMDNQTFVNLYDTNGEATLPASTVVAASRGIMIDPRAFVGFRYVKVRSGTSGSPVTQSAERAITLVVREFA